ncbi:hypothetical protein WR25_21384 [Diploscapter pachys]|uniref:Uncharacterized protein n=1 Tax=Diploscapter pachys TaxID=2018661 RepID=A0A2A2KAE0_9BILA|nr:hypothetical protein WR25_21384 [Diploscapter pachys]
MTVIGSETENSSRRMRDPVTTMSPPLCVLLPASALGDCGFCWSVGTWVGSGTGLVWVSVAVVCANAGKAVARASGRIAVAA